MLASRRRISHDNGVSVDVNEFLEWVQREHGPAVRERVAALLSLQEDGSEDPGAVLRQALIELHPRDFEYQPATDLLPYGFCSD